jgi:hypothetical protein
MVEQGGGKSGRKQDETDERTEECAGGRCDVESEHRENQTLSPFELPSSIGAKEADRGAESTHLLPSTVDVAERTGNSPRKHEAAGSRSRTRGTPVGRNWSRSRGGGGAAVSGSVQSEPSPWHDAKSSKSSACPDILVSTNGDNIAAGLAADETMTFKELSAIENELHVLTAQASDEAAGPAAGRPARRAFRVRRL